MNQADAVYLNILADILQNGEVRSDRTGTGTRSIFGAQLRLNLLAGFPLLTTKHVHFPSVRGELLWMLSGSTNVRDLQRYGVTIWDEWADEDGDLGPIYGSQWRRWQNDVFTETDQIAEAIRLIKESPDSRRILVSSWNVGDVPNMRLPPCHVLFQFSVREELYLSTHVFMRSCDAFLGLPFNMAQHALLTSMVAQVCDLKPSELVISFGDLHLYENHLEQAKLQLTREPRALPKLVMVSSVKEIDDFRVEDIAIEGYDPHPKIPAKVAV